MEQQPTIHEVPATAIGVLRLFEVSQTGIDVFSDQLIKSVQEGEVDPLELRAMIKSLEVICERVNKATQENQLRAAELHPGDKFNAFGVVFQKGDVYTKYDYTVCKDPVYNQRAAILESASEQVKERETFLKSIKTSMTIVDESSGDIVTIYPPAKKTTPGLKLSIK